MGIQRQNPTGFAHWAQARSVLFGVALPPAVGIDNGHRSPDPPLKTEHSP